MCFPGESCFFEYDGCSEYGLYGMPKLVISEFDISVYSILEVVIEIIIEILPKFYSIIVMLIDSTFLLSLYFETV